MSDRPIVMQASSVKAIEKGLKTATRRVVYPQPIIRKGWYGPGQDGLQIVTRVGSAQPKEAFVPYPIPQRQQESVIQTLSYYAVQTLWVKQRWRVFRPLTTTELDEKKRFQLLIQYGADLPTDKWKDCDQQSFIKYAHDGEWKNPRFMPRWASRLSLDVISVRLEQLGEMIYKDAIQEGIQETYTEQVETFGVGCMRYVTAQEWDKRSVLENFQWYWNSINGGKDGHLFNPDLWVWAIRFKRKEEDRDQSHTTEVHAEGHPRDRQSPREG